MAQIPAYLIVSLLVNQDKTDTKPNKTCDLLSCAHCVAESDVLFQSACCMSQIIISESLKKGTEKSNLERTITLFKASPMYVKLCPVPYLFNENGYESH